MIIQPPLGQGGGRTKVWCSHTCSSREWHRNNKSRSNAIKRKSSAQPFCKERKREYQKHHKRSSVSPEYKLWNGAKTRAKEKNLDFTIQPVDISIPDICPLLGIKLVTGRTKHARDSATLDRIDSTKGYTSTNIWVISHKANTAKSNLSLKELKMLVERLEEKQLDQKITETYA